MVIGYPDVSKDFPKLVKTLAYLEEFDYWDLVLRIYQNSNNSHLETYLSKFEWIHLDKPYPCCKELEDDFAVLENTYVKFKEGTKYSIDVNSLTSSPLSSYVKDETIPTLISS